MEKISKADENLSTIEVTMLYLPPYLIPEDVEEWLHEVSKEGRRITGRSVCVVQADPPFDEDTV